MVALNCQLHKWWGQGLLALKCAGILPVLDGQGNGQADVVLQLYWLPQRMARAGTSAPAATGMTTAATTNANDDLWRQPIRMDTGEGEAWWTEWSEQLCASVATPADNGETTASGCHIAAAVAPTSRLILTGATASLRMPLEEAYNMKAMADLQWACLTIAAMSGAAGSPDCLHYDDDDDEEGGVNDAASETDSEASMD